MSSHCATLLYHFCPLTAVSDWPMLPLPPPLLFCVVCAAPRCLGIAAARGKVHVSSVENWLPELNPPLKHFPCSCAFFPCPSPFRVEKTLSPVQAEEQTALLCCGAVCDGYIIEIIPFAPIFTKCGSWEWQDISVHVHHDSQSRYENYVTWSLLLFKAIPWLELFQDRCLLTPSWEGLHWSLKTLGTTCGFCWTDCPGVFSAWHNKAQMLSGISQTNHLI